MAEPKAQPNFWDIDEEENIKPDILRLVSHS